MITMSYRTCWQQAHHKVEKLCVSRGGGYAISDPFQSTYSASQILRTNICRYWISSVLIWCVDTFHSFQFLRGLCWICNRSAKLLWSPSSGLWTLEPLAASTPSLSQPKVAALRSRWWCGDDGGTKVNLCYKPRYIEMVRTFDQVMVVKLLYVTKCEFMFYIFYRQTLPVSPFRDAVLVASIHIVAYTTAHGAPEGTIASSLTWYPAIL